MSELKRLNKKLQALEHEYLDLKLRANNKKQSGLKLQPQELDELCRVMNSIAVGRMKEGSYQLAQSWLTRSQKYAKYSLKMQITIQNNFSCLYKKQQNYGLALAYLQKAQKNIEKLVGNCKNPQNTFIIADCSLNMCAILSSMGEHLQALNQARKIVKCLENFKDLDSTYYKEVYLVGKYNQGVELEHLHKWGQSLLAYQQGVKFAREHLPKHSLIEQIDHVIVLLNKKISLKNRTQKSWVIKVADSSPKLAITERNYSSVKQSHSKRRSSVCNENLKLPLQSNYGSQRNSFSSSKRNNSSNKTRKLTLQQIN